MSTKKVFGWIFIALASVLSLAIFGLIAQLIATTAGISAIFTGRLTSYQAGEAIGHMLYWICHLAAAFFLWKYGLRCTKSPASAS